MDFSIPKRGGKRLGAGRKRMPPPRTIHMEDPEWWALENEARQHNMEPGEYIAFLRRTLKHLSLGERD